MFKKRNRSYMDPSRALKKQYEAEQQQREYDEHVKLKDDAFVYIIAISPTSMDTFYKIGYTKNTVMERFAKETAMPSFRLVAEGRFEHFKAKEMEALLHGVFNKKRFHAPYNFAGRTECFKLTIDEVNWVKSVLK